MNYNDLRKALTAEDIIRKYDLENLKKDRRAIQQINKEISETNTYITDFAQTVLDSFKDIQNQVDGTITTWFFNGSPLPNAEHKDESNYPCNEWLTDEEKAKHIGDLYYDSDTGYAYRFAKDNDDYIWLEIKDTDVAEALARAKKAQDTADTKRQVFIVEPTPPYEVGDLWIKEDKELYRCRAKRTEGTYESVDWIPATDYTNDDYAKGVEAVLDSFKEEVKENYVVNTAFETAVDSITGSILEVATTATGNSEKLSETQQTVDSLKDTIETTTSKVKTLEETLEHYRVDFDTYNLVIPVDEEFYPLETKEYSVKVSTFFDGKEVFDSVIKTRSSCTGINVSIKDNVITFSTSESEKIENLVNEYIIEFLYSTGDEAFSLAKKINLSLAPKGLDGQQGEQGLPGEPGKDGQSTYFYVRYSENENGNPMTEAPNELTQYMGVANTTSPTPPSSYNAYTWSKIKGNDGEPGQQGIPGQPGASGQTTYLHIMYSEDGQEFTPEDGDYPLGKKPSAWFGTYTDFIEADSTEFSDYEWYKFTENIDEQLEGMQDQINNNSTAIENNKQDILDELDNYVNQSTLVEVTNRLEKVETDSQLSIDFINNVSLNGVDQVTTKTGYTFNQDGLNIDKSTSKTKNTLDENGMTITDKTGSENSELFFAGYDEDLGESIVRTKNITVSKYLTIGTHMRVEDYQADGEQAGTGFFYVG